MSQVYPAFEDFGLDFTDDLKDFFEYLVYRQTDSVTHMNYKRFFEIFEEGYLLDESPYEQDLSSAASRDSLKQASEVESPAHAHRPLKPRDDQS